MFSFAGKPDWNFTHEFIFLENYCIFSGFFFASFLWSSFYFFSGLQGSCVTAQVFTCVLFCRQTRLEFNGWSFWKNYCISAGFLSLYFCCLCFIFPGLFFLFSVLFRKIKIHTTMQAIFLIKTASDLHVFLQAMFCQLRLCRLIPFEKTASFFP